MAHYVNMLFKTSMRFSSQLIFRRLSFQQMNDPLLITSQGGAE